MTKAIFIPAGSRFGELTSTGERKNHPETGRPVWRCVCDCGKDKWSTSSGLTRGSVKTCGTHPTQVSKEAARKLLQGKAKYPKATGAGTKLYRAWRALKSRCTVPTDASYPGYGGLGVAVCAEWMEYEPFRAWSVANGFGEGLTIDRKDPFGNYEPGNCRWVTMAVQARNKRVPCHDITAFGETKLEVDWVTDLRCAVKGSTLRERIRAGWPSEKALTQPRGSSIRAVVQFEAFGETKTVRAWAVDPRCKVEFEALRARVRRGVVGEAALAGPLPRGFRSDLQGTRNA